MLRFYLKRNSVYASIYCADGRLAITTGVKVDPEMWGDGWFIKRNRAQASAQSLLEAIRARVDKHIHDCGMNNLPVLTRDIRPLINAQGVVKASADFFALYDEVIRKCRRGELLTPGSGERYSEGTIRGWEVHRGIMREFAEQQGVSLEPSGLTIEMVRLFVPWMSKRGAGSKNYSNLQLRRWRDVLKKMHQLGYHNNTIFLHEDFRPNMEMVDKIFLTEKEVEKIYKLKLSSPYMDGCRDRWILMYCTGLRVSDNRRLTVEHFGKENITLVNKKTGKKVVIPYHWMVEELIKKHNGKLPHNYAEQKINDAIKLIAQQAGITDTFTYKITQKGVKKEVTKQKWELITNHTARRSITSNMIKNKISHDIAGDMLGMSASTWAKYNKLTAEDKAKVLKGFGVFKKGR